MPNIEILIQFAFEVKANKEELYLYVIYGIEGEFFLQ